MKKFLVLLLAAVCVFSLFSCGDDSLKAFTNAMGDTEPTEVVLNITVGTAYGDLDASYVTTYNEDGSFKLAYSYEEFAAIEEGTADDVVTVKTGEVSCDKDGNFSDGGAVSGKAETLSGDKMSLSKKNMTYTVSADGDVLYATVEAADTEKVFGVEIAGDVSLVITKADGKVISYSMTYTLDSGDVVVTCEYK